MKILILGHGRHGKDTVAEYIQQNFGLNFTSSSLVCAELFIYDKLKNLLGYTSSWECFNDRHNHRELWFGLIRAYSYYNKTRLTNEILERYDMYVGMRNDEEYQVSKGLFDKIFWVDAFGRVDYTDPTMKILFDPAEMELIDNSGTLAFMELQVNERLKCLY